MDHTALIRCMNENPVNINKALCGMHNAFAVVWLYVNSVRVLTMVLLFFQYAFTVGFTEFLHEFI